ncbi:MAG: hypothetical protein ACFFCH_02145 [Promethearchaeota archaeon]
MGFDLVTANSGAIAVISIIGAIIVSRFAVRRYREVPVEYRFATYPTMLVAIAFLFYALGSFSGVVDVIIPIGDIVQYKLTISLVATGNLMVAFAALLAIERRKFSIPVFILYFIGIFVVWTAPGVPMPLLNTVLMVLVIAILGFGPAILFGYLWTKTRKTTVFSLFIGILLISISGSARGMSPTNPFAPILSWIGLFGYTIITIGFLLPDLDIGGEFLGYTAALVIMAAQVVWVLMWYDFVPIAELFFTAATQIAAGLAFISATFLWGRYRIKPHYSTILLFSFFLFIAIGYILYVIDVFARFVPELSWVPPVVGTLGTYLGFVGVAFAAASAIYAMEWRPLTLLPFIIAIPLTIIAVFFFPEISHPGAAEVFPANVFWWSTIGLLSLFFFIPIILYSLIYKRLRKEPFSGRGKALGLALGLFLIFPAHITFVPIFIRATIRVFAFAILLIALTGWLDRLLDRGNTKTEAITA